MKKNIPQVPVLYEGPYSREIADNLVSGKTSLDQTNIREGIVIKPKYEHTDIKIGRVCLKHVSEEYLTRKGGTELA